jgi:hypothetical protein
LWAAHEALSSGPEGVRAVAEALAMSPVTLWQGQRELQGEPSRPDSGLVGGRQRRPGGGRKSIQEKHPSLLRAIEHIVDPAPRGGPQGSSQVDIEKVESHRERAESARLFDQRHHRGQVMARGVGIPSASFGKNPRRCFPSGPGRAVPLSQRFSARCFKGGVSR